MARTYPDLPADLTEAEQLLRQVVGESDDLHYDRLSLQGGARQALLVFVTDLAGREDLQRYVLEPLAGLQPGQTLPGTLLEFGRQTLHVVGPTYCANPADVRDWVYRGYSALLLDGYPGALRLATQRWEERSVQSPPTETALRGPRDGFVENLGTNLGLVRRRLCDRHLMVKFFRVGTRTQTKVALLSIEDIANPRLVDEIASRLGAVSFDSVLDTFVLRELLVGQPSPFPKMEATERPDKVVAALLSGKVAVLADNSPFGLTAPATLLDSMWAADDYYGVPATAVLVRGIRLLGVLVTLFLSPMYIGIELYTPGLIRTDLALYLAMERAGVPLNPALEIIFLELMMELVQEATIRLPAKVGSAATVVGGLIVGQAAVEARLLSGVVVVVAAISAIGSFTMPGSEMGQIWRIVKWGLILAAIFLGVYGVFAAGFILFAWLTSQDSFGTPYLAPVAPAIPGDLKRDGLMRRGWDRVVKRGRAYRPTDTNRADMPQSNRYRDGGER